MDPWIAFFLGGFLGMVGGFAVGLLCGMVSQQEQQAAARRPTTLSTSATCGSTTYTSPPQKSLKNP